MTRYNLQDARRYIVQAIKKLNSIKGLDFNLLDLEYADLMGWDFIKVHLYEGNTADYFDSMLNEFIFTREDTMSKLDKLAKIEGKNLSDEDKIILRIAYTILKDWQKV